MPSGSHKITSGHIDLDMYETNLVVEDESIKVSIDFLCRLNHKGLVEKENVCDIFFLQIFFLYLPSYVLRFVLLSVSAVFEIDILKKSSVTKEKLH